jgi:hypothetical protein
MIQRAQWLVLAWLASALSGCTITVTPPPPPIQPRTVYLIDQQYSASLVLPHDDRMTRYVYAEWHYYALNEKGPLSALRALLVPSEATLGRRTITPAVNAEALPRTLGIEVERVHCLTVSSKRVQALRQRLDRAAEQRRSVKKRDLESGLTFVPYGRTYHLFHNSNTVVAAWLGELGCEVQGLAVLSKWRVQYPASQDGARPAPRE